jgi:hypothetical protein
MELESPAGTTVFTTSDPATSSDWSYGFDASSGERVNIFGLELLEDKPAGVSQDVKSYFGAYNTSVRLDTSVLVALGTDFIPKPPDPATIISPSDESTDKPINITLSWGMGLGAESHDIYLGTDETSVTNATNASPEFKGNQVATTYLAASLQYETTYYWRIDEKNQAGTTAGYIWEFTTTEPPPAQASNPVPGDGTGDIERTQALSWTAGARTQSHDVYFGETQGSPDFKGNQALTSYDPPGLLTPNVTYYWRIDEVNVAGTTTGEEWSFTTIIPKTRIDNVINQPFPSTIEIFFNEDLQETATLLTPSSYTFNHGAYATAVSKIGVRVVRVTVENLFDYETFTVTVNENVLNNWNAPMDPNYNSFEFYITPSSAYAQSISAANGRLKSGQEARKIVQDGNFWYILTETGVDMVSRASLANRGFVLDLDGFNTICISGDED